jgi:OmpA-OmpF porin, OOP family
MATLLDSLTSLVTPATGQIADKLGESEAAVTSALPSTFASVFGGLVTKTKDPGAFRQVFDFITSRPAGANLPADAQSLLGSFVAGGTVAATGTKFLNMVFGGQTNAVANLLTRIHGFKNPSSGAALLTLAAPLALGALGKRVRDDRLDSSGLANVLSSERDAIFAAMPAGLSSLISSTFVPSVETPDWNRATTSTRQFADTHTSESRRWVWPVVGLATLALVWLALSHKSARVPQGTAVVDTTTHIPGITGTAGGEVSSGLETLGAFTKRALPNGVELSIPANGIEAKLIGFIEDPNSPVDKTTWFEFDRLNFATGSAKILPESQEQLSNIVAVMKAYPNVKVKIGGYTDNVGAPAANLRLSQQRANAVKQAIAHDGVAANRLQAQGYGEQQPVADNSTEEGRAQNRRIALRVTAK